MLYTGSWVYIERSRVSIWNQNQILPMISYHKSLVKIAWEESRTTAHGTHTILNPYQNQYLLENNFWASASEMMRQNIPNLSYFRLDHKSASCSQLQGRYSRACDLCTNPSIRVLLREACTWSSKFSGTINYTNITRDPGSRDPNTHACMHHAGTPSSLQSPVTHEVSTDSLVITQDDSTGEL